MGIQFSLLLIQNIELDRGNSLDRRSGVPMIDGLNNSFFFFFFFFFFFNVCYMVMFSYLRRVISPRIVGRI